MRFRNSDRSCVVDGVCNAGLLFLGDSRALSVNIRFSEVAWRASQRCRPHDEGKAEISDFTSVGHLEHVFQGLGGDLYLKKVKNLPPHGHREPAHAQFN